MGRNVADDKPFRCDCGYRLRAPTEGRQIAEVRAHAWVAHGISFSTEEALAVLLRLELDVDEEQSARAAMGEDPTQREEQ